MRKYFSGLHLKLCPQSRKTLIVRSYCIRVTERATSTQIGRLHNVLSCCIIIVWQRYKYTTLNVQTSNQCHYAGIVDGDAFVLIVGALFAVFPRPHLMVTFSPSISNPFAHACAAVSADDRSLKLTNAHLNYASVECFQAQ